MSKSSSVPTTALPCLSLAAQSADHRVCSKPHYQSFTPSTQATPDHPAPNPPPSSTPEPTHPQRRDRPRADPGVRQCRPHCHATTTRRSATMMAHGRLPKVNVDLTARVGRGLEWVCADEIAALAGATDVTMAAREVRFTAPNLGPAITGLRTADDVFVRLGTVRGVGRDRRAPVHLARAVAGLDAVDAIDLVRDQRPVAVQPGLDVVASVQGDRRFNRYDVEDAVGLALGRHLGMDHRSRRSGQPAPSDLSLRVSLDGDRAEVGLRVATRPLHRRTWKRSTGPATLHPPAAAALVRLAGPSDVLIDPFCGDGTIPIEAALAGRRAVTGADLDPARLAHARANAWRAGVAVSLACADAARGPWRPEGATACVTNPPWDRAVRAGGQLAAGLAAAWIEAGRLLEPSGTLAVIADAELTLASDLEGAGWVPALNQQVRLAGRVCRLMITVPDAGAPNDPISASLRAWQDRALHLGLITRTGF